MVKSTSYIALCPLYNRCPWSKLSFYFLCNLPMKAATRQNVFKVLSIEHSAHAFSCFLFCKDIIITFGAVELYKTKEEKCMHWCEKPFMNGCTRQSEK